MCWLICLYAIFLPLGIFWPAAGLFLTVYCFDFYSCILFVTHFLLYIYLNIKPIVFIWYYLFYDTILYSFKLCGFCFAAGSCAFVCVPHIKYCLLFVQIIVGLYFIKVFKCWYIVLIKCRMSKLFKIKDSKTIVCYDCLKTVLSF